MLNDKICEKRNELNKSIVTGQDYSITYKLSVELDELIAQFYRYDMQKDRDKKQKLVRITV